ncbi:MAG: DUF402 domain-containing protein, partial [Anaerolineae bacterium]|nr:DUF402 domain-containing protein [Anaerolineae bacterium]
MLDRSSEEASRTDDGYVGTAHLLLAIANEQGTMAARILARAGLTRRDILAALSRIRTAETAPGASDTDVQIEAKSGLQPQLVLRQGPNEVRIALRDTTALIEELSSAATELTRHQMKIGDRVQVKAYKSDGTCYRWWTATVETVAPDELALVTPAGHLIQDPGGDFRSKHALRVFYWPGKWYSLLEAYAPSGELVEIYVNISSPVEIEG